MLFSPHLLRYYDFVINTEENFGFMIAEEGIVGESQFSGEPAFSITSTTNLHLLNDIPNVLGSEVLIRSNVDVKYLRALFFNTPPPSDILVSLDNKRVPFFNIW
nr:hypothetical protein PPFHPHBJ_00008 [Cydia pomonella granulovirus]WOZ44784.1 hypothetical protein HDNAPKKO_00010 [Cydia pomonella granulovirus]WOZ44920.1 hypothetical protein GGGKFHNK_00008 [Cydia pomonella granulovirus]WOZ45056.1 hypothetical protein BGFFOGFG_00008 [Cydia pomonella granulovirus]WOZ45577.1 hypothetical protein AAGMHLIN_00006 [Cydia pomonella granulovirus]